MALKLGFSERYFVKYKFWNSNENQIKHKMIWYDWKAKNQSLGILKLRSNDENYPW